MDNTKEMVVVGIDPSLKKKKKKKIDLDSVLSGGGSSTNDDGGGGGLGTGTGPAGARNVVSFLEPEEAQAKQEGGQSELLESLESFGLKKKKKSKKPGGGPAAVEVEEPLLVVLLGDVEEENIEDAEEIGLDFGQLKKKKKGKVVLGEEQQQQQEDLIDAPDMVINASDDEQSSEGTCGPVRVAPPSSEKSWLTSDRDYTYEELLCRVFEIMHAKNPEMASGTKQKFVMRPPQVLRVGTKKTSFVNFMEICKMLHRHQKHLLDFLLSELGTSGSIDGNNQLIIKGKFQQKQIENVLRRYIKEYVTCHTCRSPNTILQKDSRIFFLQCEACGSRCSVASIKHGFQAVTSKRAAIRAKAT